MGLYANKFYYLLLTRDETYIPKKLLKNAQPIKTVTNR